MLFVCLVVRPLACTCRVLGCVTLDMQPLTWVVRTQGGAISNADGLAFDWGPPCGRRGHPDVTVVRWAE